MFHSVLSIGAELGTVLDILLDVLPDMEDVSMVNLVTTDNYKIYSGIVS